MINTKKIINQVFAQIDSKTIVILGLGREGYSTYNFLRKYLPEKEIFLVDQKNQDELDQKWQEVARNDQKASFATSLDQFEDDLEGDSKNDSQKKPLIFRSPGLPPSSPLILQAKNLYFDFDSNTNLFLKLIETLNHKHGQENSKNLIKTIGVTGTKGKSTTTSMIDHVLKSCGIDSLLGGNIGIAPLSLWDELIRLSGDQKSGNQPKGQKTGGQSKNIVVVLEMSSHQLNNVALSPNISVLLDISPEHLDYYENFEQYAQAKANISKFQTQDDLVIFNSDHDLPKNIANQGKARQISYNPDEIIQENQLIYRGQKIIELNQLQVIGRHNILNSIPSIIIASELSCSPEDIKQGLQTFKPLPHRLEIVKNSDGIKYINDSLSTTPESTIAAIKSFPENPIVLIAGGHDRNLDFSQLAATIQNHKIKHLILLPDTGEKILEAVQKLESEKNIASTEFSQVENMPQAVKKAKNIAKSGDVVLLSPASASFGHFKDYQDRGEQFIKAVNS